MIYVGFALYIFVIVAAIFIGPARKFYVDSLELAPEITLLVSIFYCYVVLITMVLTFMPKLMGDRASFHNVHVKMACSVMVSLGLVGTFLGLVDMISGIGAALSGEEKDFSKRMATLLGAISASLGAMSFAFMTSILGVGLSAYVSVAATFVGSHFVGSKKVHLEKVKRKEIEDERQFQLENVQKQEEEEKIAAEKRAEITANEIAPMVKSLIESTFLPIANKLEDLEVNQTELLEYLVTENPLRGRLDELEQKIGNLNLAEIEKKLMPLALVETLDSQHLALSEHNKSIAQSLEMLNSSNAHLIDFLSESANAMKEQSHHIEMQTKALEENTHNIASIEHSFTKLGNNVENIITKFKKVFD